MSSVLSPVVVYGIVMLSLPTSAGAPSRTPSRDVQVSALFGTVSDTNGIALPDAVIYVQELRKETRSRASGAFRFERIPTGTYLVSARLIGYVSRARLVSVGPGDTPVDFRLSRIHASLPTIVATAARGGLSGNTVQLWVF